MAVGNPFNQWQKDIFFSAAEAVQESADIMESIYRMWIGGQKDGLTSGDSDELLKALHTAVGTAKWQLEDFARAVSLSHQSCLVEDNTVTRHRQFISAIGEQISLVEKSLSDTIAKQGKQPIRWVQLDKDERDDLENFLSAALLKVENRNSGNDSKPVYNLEIASSCRNVPCTVNKEARETNDVVNQAEQIDGHRRTFSSPDDISSWKIVIADEDPGRKNLLQEKLENSKHHLFSFPSKSGMGRSRWFRNSFPKSKSGGPKQFGTSISSCLGLNGVSRFAQGIRKLNQKRCCLISGEEDSKVYTAQQLGMFCARRSPGLPHLMHYSRSLRIALLLVFTVFLIVPYVFYMR